MTDTNVFQLSQPGSFTDSLTEVLRSGARALLAQAVEAEVADFLSQHADRKTAGELSSAAPASSTTHYTQFAGLETLTIRPDSNFQMIGERTNVTGSDRKSTRLNSSHSAKSRMPSSA